MTGTHAQTVRLQAAGGKAEAVFDPYGGRLIQLRLVADGNAVDVIHTDEPPIPDTPYHSTPLAPWPNRIADGAYTYNGIGYQIPVNEPQRNCALHGLVYNQPWTVEPGKEPNTLTLSIRYDGTEPGYPWPFHLAMDYALAPDRLTMTWRATTPVPTTIPFGLGWHPYYYVPAGLDQALLHIPGSTTYVTDDRLLPLQAVPRTDAYQQLAPLGNQFYDQCFATPETPTAEVRLADPARGIRMRLWQDSGQGRFGWFQVYTTPERDRIAIEPMTCPPNAFNTGEGLLYLSADAPLQVQSGIIVESWKP